MATYKGIKGFKVQSLASDPTASESIAPTLSNLDDILVLEERDREVLNRVIQKQQQKINEVIR